MTNDYLSSSLYTDYKHNRMQTIDQRYLKH